MPQRRPDSRATKGRSIWCRTRTRPAFNPMLSPYYLKGNIPWERCFPFGQGFYRDYDITCHFDVPAESLDAVNQEVTLANGRTLPYDRCLIATGASPVIPPVPGLKDSPRAFPLRTAASARRLEKAISSSRRAVVLGASLVGLKVAEILKKRRYRCHSAGRGRPVAPPRRASLRCSHSKEIFRLHRPASGCLSRARRREKIGRGERHPGAWYS